VPLKNLFIGAVFTILYFKIALILWHALYRCYFIIIKIYKRFKFVVLAVVFHVSNFYLYCHTVIYNLMYFIVPIMYLMYMFIFRGSLLTLECIWGSCGPHMVRKFHVLQKQVGKCTPSSVYSLHPQNTLQLQY
jgi:hypothetical protein